MDIISHGLWGGLAFGRKQKKLYWWAAAFGIMPDFLSFGIYTILTVLGIMPRPDWSSHPVTPDFVHSFYNVTHSLVIFIIVFAIVWLIRKKAFLPLLAWPIHILMDIPTHSAEFFPTPFLWPVSNFHVNGIPWSNPYIILPDLALLLIFYAIWWWRSKKLKKLK